MDLAIGVTTV